MPVSFRSPEAFARTVGVSANAVATFKSIGAWAATATTVYGAIAVVIDIINKMTADDPVEEALSRLESQVQGIKDDIHRALLLQRVQRAEEVRGDIMAVAAALKDFDNTHAEQTRSSLVERLDFLLGEILGRGGYNANLVPFHRDSWAMLSGEPTPHWMGGDFLDQYGYPILGAPPWIFGSALPPQEVIALPFPSTSLCSIQVLRPASNSPHVDWQVPACFTPSAPRWDGRFNHGLLVLGAMLYESVLRSVEPYYRATGLRRESLSQIVSKLTEFADDWERQLLITANMPAPADSSTLIFAFQSWPCGAVDPVFGTSAYEREWWTGGGPLAGTIWADTGIMGQNQLGSFSNDRRASLDYVRRTNGLKDLRSMISGMRELLAPPSQSESMTIYTDRAVRSLPETLSSAPATAKTFNIITPGSTFQGVHEARKVAVRVPIAIQANPGLADIPNLPRLAMSDVTFGYEIALIPAVGERIPVFMAKLRRNLGEEGLWHTTALGEDGLQPVPRQTDTRLIQYKAHCYLQYVDPSGEPQRSEDLGVETVALHCRVQVSDAAHHPVPGLSAVWPPRGVLWLELSSDDSANPSFDVHFEVTETTAVGQDGRPTKIDQELVRYTAQGGASVQARVGVFPVEYYEQYEKEREQFFNLMKQANQRYVRVESQLDRLGPPEELVDPLGPLRGRDEFAGVTRLLDDPVWFNAIVGELQRAAGNRVEVDETSIRRGIAQLAARPTTTAREYPRVGQRDFSSLQSQYR